ncbi:NUDIX domain-containing protein [Pelagibacterales bacterium SAG-MED03]|nr:NUDIX domain-containing protein [Pelagibacterales bacterium SAG-MED03]
MQLIQNNPKNASAVIIYHKKKILLILRSNHKKIFYPNCYGIFGGAKEKNETYLDTAKRELFEETNLNISKKHIQYLIDINFSFPKFKMIKRKIYTYEITNLNKFKKNFILGEGVDSKFFKYNEIKNIANIVPYDKLAIDLFFARKIVFKI